MEVLKLGAWPGLAAEQLKGALAAITVGNAVHNVDSMKDCERPSFNIGNIRPMDGSMM